jgi:hypothetical protein
VGKAMTSEHAQYWIRRGSERAKYKRKFLERHFWWWRNSTDRFAFLTAIFTALLFIATALLYWATRDLVRESADTAKRQLRAYVAFSTTNGFKITPTELIAIIQNFGQTPAKDATIWGSWEFVPFGDDLPEDFLFLVKPPCGGNPPGPDGGQHVLPGPITVYPNNPTPAHKFHCPQDAADLKRAANNELNAFLYGYISYLDIFDDRHRTNYCFFCLPAIQTGLQCNRHNEFDPEKFFQ